jgi:hypothetical protein
MDGPKNDVLNVGFQKIPEFYLIFLMTGVMSSLTEALAFGISQNISQVCAVTYC